MHQPMPARVMGAFQGSGVGSILCWGSGVFGLQGSRVLGFCGFLAQGSGVLDFSLPGLLELGLWARQLSCFGLLCSDLGHCALCHTDYVSCSCVSTAPFDVR